MSKREREERSGDKNEKKLKGDPESLVLRALKENDLSRARKLLLERAQTPCNRRWIEDWTNLFLVCFLGYADCLKVLIQNGADVNAVDKGRSTALHEAAQKGHVDVVEVLVENGADPVGWYAQEGFRRSQVSR